MGVTSRGRWSGKHTPRRHRPLTVGSLKARTIHPIGCSTRVPEGLLSASWGRHVRWVGTRPSYRVSLTRLPGGLYARPVPRVARAEEMHEKTVWWRRFVRTSAPNDCVDE